MKRRLRPKEGTANFITLHHKNHTSIVDNYDLITKNPDRASEQAITRLIVDMGLLYDRRLMDVVSYEKGHMLIYDKHQVLAYTTIRI